MGHFAICLWCGNVFRVSHPKEPESFCSREHARLYDANERTHGEVARFLPYPPVDKSR